MLSRFPPRSRTALCVAAGALCLAARAQTTTSTPAALQPVLITGNPLRSSDIAQPSSTLGGEALLMRRGSTLGETLDGLPGVSSSYFGPNANRPMIRGQDGDRIRVLNNAGASLDASSLSFDHAVPIDPLVVERVEVLRGPAALLYGGSAVGGVVNAIDNRIPREPIGKPSGTAEARYGGAAREKGLSALVEAGSGADSGNGFALHADAFRRRTDDLRVPAFERPVDGGTERRERIVNSASRANGGALGASMVWGQGYLGAAVDTYRNDYGIVAEEDVTIRMKRDKFALAGELRDLGGPIRAVRGQVQQSDYKHEEVEGSGAVGTTFDNKGTDARFELEHSPLALGATTLRGVFGLQTENARFSALGDEAFVPSTKTRQGAAFVFEELALGALKLSFGGRLERTTVDSAGDADPAVPRFGPAQSRRFDTGSVAVGSVYDWTPQWQLSGSLAYTERAPTYAELYANGVHLATASFERGAIDQRKEKGTNIDVALQWKEGAHQLKVGAYASHFSTYIALLRTGEPDFVNADGEAFPVHAFTGVSARLYGYELAGTWRLLDGSRTVDVDGKLDTQRATNHDTGEPLPRIAPLRATLGANTTIGAWKARVEVVHAARQTRVPSDDVETPGYTFVHVATNYRLQLGDAEVLLFAKLTNIGNRLAYNAATTASVRPLSPLPARALLVGMQVAF
jgi:iron complex outermembrane receptor protein